VLSAFAAGLFLFHPLQSESAADIAGRSESLSVLLSYAALLLFLRCRDEEISWRRAGAVLALTTAAMLAKEHAVVLPLVFLLTDAYWSAQTPRQWLWRHRRLYAALALGAAGSAVMIVFVLLDSKSAGFHLPGLSWHEYLFTQFRAIWVYVGLFAWPVNQNVDHAFPFSRSLLDHGSLWGLLALLTALAAAIALRKRFKLASSGRGAAGGGGGLLSAQSCLARCNNPLGGRDPQGAPQCSCSISVGPCLLRIGRLPERRWPVSAGNLSSAGRHRRSC
jgi:hypothetical protein